MNVHQKALGTSGGKRIRTLRERIKTFVATGERPRKKTQKKAEQEQGLLARRKEVGYQGTRSDSRLQEYLSQKKKQEKKKREEERISQKKTEKKQKEEKRPRQSETSLIGFQGVKAHGKRGKVRDEALRTALALQKGGGKSRKGVDPEKKKKH